MKQLFLKNKILILLSALLIAAFYLRTYNINWDQNTHLHPDERAIIMFTLPLNIPENISELLSPDSPLNPKFFAYGNLPLYILKIMSTLASTINPNLAEYDGINLVGRFISAVIDTLTIILIYKLGSIIFNRKAGFAAAILYTFSVFSIQLAHFFTADTLLTFFIISTLYRLIKFYKDPNIINSILVGVFFGLSLSTKVSALPLIIAIITTLIIDFLLIFLSKPHHFKNWFPHIPKLIKRLFRDGIFIFLSTVVTFLITQPYALIDYKNFIDQNLLQSQMTHNAYIFPYTLQYATKIPVLHELSNIFFWGQGIFIASICFMGALLWLPLNMFRLKSEQKSEVVILYSFLIVFFLIVSNFSVGWMRYLLPIYPILCILGGAFLANLFINKLSETNKILKYAALLSLAIIILIWPISFMNIYQNTHPRIEASNWIHENIPYGSTVAVEHWDDRLPLNNSQSYSFEELTLYDQPDDEKKWQLLNLKLQNSDYIIVASNRLSTPLPKLSDCSLYERCYPLSKKYYEDLFAERLAFEKIAEFRLYPKIPFLNIEINDEKADESFTVYDHPKVIIFKNTRL